MLVCLDVGAGKPVAVHCTSSEIPPDTVTVGFGEIVATGATANGEHIIDETAWRF